VEFRVADSLLCYPKSHDGLRSFVIEIDGADFGYKVEDERLLWAIQQLPRHSFSELEAKARLSEGPLDEQELSELWSFLLEAGIVTSGSKASGAVHAMASSAAGAYHAYTRDYPFMQMKRSDSLWADNGIMITYAKEKIQPSLFQEFNYCERVPLLSADEILLVEEGNKPASVFEKLCFSLNYCAGVRNVIEDGFNKEYHFLQLPTVTKVVPSGGGRHPTEVFVAVRSITGLTPGVYHYNPLRNSLDLINKDPEALQLALCADTEVSAAIMIVSNLERAMWRYREPRSWRAILVDAGHVVHAFRFVLAAMGIKTEREGTFSEKNIAAAIGVSSDEQPCLAVVSIIGE
jgi:SagB-type dehydrogenase family enzyme